MRMDFRKPYDAERDAFEAELCQVDTGEDTLVQQQFREDADINVLVRRFGLLGAVPPAVTDPRYYGDVSDVPDLRTALDRIRDAKERFMALPSNVRRRFDNDPAELFAFLNDEANRDEAVRLGLLVKKEEPAPPAPAPPGDVSSPSSSDS